MKTPFSKMDGLGNQIIVVDMRESTHALTPQAILALSADPEMHFDQIMAIHTPTQKKPTSALKYGILMAQRLKLVAMAPAVSLHGLKTTILVKNFV